MIFQLQLLIELKEKLKVGHQKKHGNAIEFKWDIISFFFFLSNSLVARNSPF